MTPAPSSTSPGGPVTQRFSKHENGESHPATIDQGVAGFFHTVQDKMSHSYNDLENYVKRSPTQAVVSAFAAGYLLKMLPVEAIVAAQVRLALSLVRPALFLYGAAKAYEFVVRQKRQ